MQKKELELIFFLNLSANLKQMPQWGHVTDFCGSGRESWCTNHPFSTERGSEYFAQKCEGWLVGKWQDTASS